MHENCKIPVDNSNFFSTVLKCLYLNWVNSIFLLISTEELLEFEPLPHLWIYIIFNLREAIFKNHAGAKIDSFKFWENHHFYYFFWIYAIKNLRKMNFIKIELCFGHLLHTQRYVCFRMGYFLWKNISQFLYLSVSKNFFLIYATKFIF